MIRYMFLFTLLLAFCASASNAALISPIDVHVGEEVTLTLRIKNTSSAPIEMLSARIKPEEMPGWLKQKSTPKVDLVKPLKVALLPLRIFISPHAEINTVETIDVVLTDNHGHTWSFSVPLAIYDIIPKESRLYQNYPNPFNPETWIPYQLKQPAFVSIRIYNATGIPVCTLFLGHKEAGTYLSKKRAAYWDGRNDRGEKVASGVYFYAIDAGNYTAVRKLIVLK